MSDLTTLANVKAFVGNATTNDDALLSALITRASTYIQSWLNRTFAIQTYTETYDGNGGTVMLLPNYPITGIVSLSIDNIPILQASDPTQTGFLWNKDKISLNGYRFTRNMQNVQVVYTAGYASTPPDVEDACIELVAHVYKSRDRIGMSSKAVGGETTSFIVKDMPDYVKGILTQYKRVICI